MSAVTTGRPTAIACHTLLGTTRAALALSPKTPRQMAARPTSAPRRLVGHPALPGQPGRAVAARAPPPASRRAGRRRSAAPAAPRAAAPPRAPWRPRAAGRACRRRGRWEGRPAAGPGGSAPARPPPARRRRARAGTPKRSASQSAPAAVSAITRSAARTVARSTPASAEAVRRPARPRSPAQRVGERDHHVDHQRHPAGARDAPGRQGVRLGRVARDDRLDARLARALDRQRRPMPPAKRPSVRASGTGRRNAPALWRSRSQTGRWRSTTSTPDLAQARR